MVFRVCEREMWKEKEQKVLTLTNNLSSNCKLSAEPNISLNFDAIISRGAFLSVVPD